MAGRGTLVGLVTVLAVSASSGCTHRAAAPPVSPRSRPAEAAAADVAAAAPVVAVAPATPQAQTPPAESLPRAVRAPSRQPVESPPDSASEEAFLDTLRAISADSVEDPPGSPPSDAVRREAAELFGAPPVAAAGPTWDIDVATYASNERVQFYIDYFTTRARRHFEVYLARLPRYDSMIRGRLAAGGLPQDMVYLALIESGMNPNAVSRSRAVGMWQFIAATGRRYGLTVDPWLDERRDPFLSTDAAIRFLRELNNRFGSLYLAAAAYNSGPGKINRGLNRFDFGALEGDDVFFALAEERFLRRETQDYVPKLIAAAIVAKQPELYGFTDIVPLPPWRYDSVRVRYAVGLDVLARLADTAQAALEELNPQLVRRVTPPSRAVWVRVPEGKAEVVTARLAALPPRERVTFLTHTIRRGETLGGISLRYRVSVDDIMSANRGLRPRSLSIGRELVIPTSGVPAAARAAWERANRPVPSASASASRPTATRAQPSRATSARSTTTAGSATAARRTVHIVRRGETLYGIAEQFRVPLSALLSHNRLTARSVIRPGDTIRIPS